MKLVAAGLIGVLGAVAFAQLPDAMELRQPVRVKLDNEPLQVFFERETQGWTHRPRLSLQIRDLRISAEGSWPSWRLFLDQLAELLDAEWKGQVLEFRSSMRERLNDGKSIGDNAVREGRVALERLRQAASSSPEQLQIELNALREEVNALRQARPEGWTDQVEARLERIEQQIRPLLDNPLLHTLLRQPMSRMEQRWDAMANRYRATVRHRGEEATWVADAPAGASQPLNQERVGSVLQFPRWELAPDQTTRPWSAGLSFPATDADVARFAARAAGMRWISLDSRARDLASDLPLGLSARDLRFEMERRSLDPQFGLGMADGTLLLRPETGLFLGLHSIVSQTTARLEQTGGYDLTSFFAWANSLYALGLEDHLGNRMAPRVELRATAPFWQALRLLGQLSPDQIRLIQSGQPLPWHTLPRDLAEELLATRQPFAERGEGWREAALNDPNQRNGLFVYFERLVRVVERASGGPGLTLQGGINDGVGQDRRPAAQLYETEFSVYLGYRFDQSIVIRGWLTSAVPPPEPVLEKGAAPPKGHEGTGHGPDSDCPLCNPR